MKEGSTSWYHVPANWLMAIAGTVWCLGGVMVFNIGFPILLHRTSPAIWDWLGAGVVFLAFYLLIFRNLVKKHLKRIKARHRPRLPFWDFFDGPSYIVMAIMMSGGMAVRTFHMVPDRWIGIVYTGIGGALFACGTRFYSLFLRRQAQHVPDAEPVAASAPANDHV